MKPHLNNFLASMLWCTKCDLHKTRKNVVVGEGNSNADILIIGDYPKDEDDIVGQPFKSDTNKILRELIFRAGIKNKIYMTNIVKCKIPGNRKPSDVEINFCIKYLKRQVSQIQPKAVIGIGNFVSNKISKEIDVEIDHGKITTLENGMLFMPIYDLNILNKNKNLADITVNELEKLNRTL